LTVDDVVKDFDAICDRVDDKGLPQPPFVSNVADNRIDLGWHQKEFQLRRSFAYTVVAPDESPDPVDRARFCAPCRRARRTRRSHGSRP
jgi:hypothetical protein